MKHLRAVIFDIDSPFDELWSNSGVKEAYLNWVEERIQELIKNLYSYNPGEIVLSEYTASIEMLAYTTTELMAQFCAGGFRWISTDKARFLSPTVDLEAVIRNRAFEHRVVLGPYFDSVKFGVWGFLEVSEYTKSWLEAKNFNEQQVAYLLWSAQKALKLLHAEERVPGFTDLALSDTSILGAYSKCESPIESILYMQFVVDGLRPPELQNQWHIGSYRVDFAIPVANIAIECDGKKYHDSLTDAERDKKLGEMGWLVIRFPSDKILLDPSYCTLKVQEVYPWMNIKKNKADPHSSIEAT